jgi:hypothetical protein
MLEMKFSFLAIQYSKSQTNTNANSVKCDAMLVRKASSDNKKHRPISL